MKLRTDDEIFRVSPTWLGPVGFRIPWDARFLAYVVWLVVLLVILAVKALTFGVHIGWDVCLSIAATYYLMQYVDYDRPLRSLWRPLFADLTGPRHRDTAYEVAPCAYRVKVEKGEP